MKKAEKQVYEEMERFYLAMNNMDKTAIKMFYDMLWSDIFMYIIQAFFMGASYYASWWVWSNRQFAPPVPYFAVYLAVWFGAVKQTLDSVHSVINFINRYKHVQKAKIDVKNYDRDKKARAVLVKKMEVKNAK